MKPSEWLESAGWKRVSYGVSMTSWRDPTDEKIYDFIQAIQIQDARDAVPCEHVWNIQDGWMFCEKCRVREDT